jgi:hypothetical protein
MSTAKRTKRHEIMVTSIVKDNDGNWHAVCIDLTDDVIYTLLKVEN